MIVHTLSNCVLRFKIPLLALSTLFLLVDPAARQADRAVGESVYPIYWDWRQPPFTIYWGHVIPAAFLPRWGGENQELIYVFTGDYYNYTQIPDGLWASLDRGKTWENRLLNPRSRFNDLEIHPQESDILFIAEDNTYDPGGIDRSEDGGWTWANVLSGRIVYDIEVDPLNPAIVYASTCCTPIGGVFRSEDTGETWNQVAPETYLSTIRPHPTQEGVVYGARWFSSSFEEGIYYSSDYGTTWEQIAGLYGGQPYLEIDPHNPDRMVAFGRSYGGIWLSENGGQDWELISEALPIIIADPTILSAAFDPSAPETIWVGLKYGGIYVTRNDGLTWEPSNSGIYAGSGINGPQCLGMDFNKSGDLIIVCDGLFYVGLEILPTFIPLILNDVAAAFQR